MREPGRSRECPKALDRWHLAFVVPINAALLVPSADAVWRQEELLGVLHKKLEDIKVVQQRLSQARKNIESLLEDMFDFDNVPSLQTQVGVAQPPVNDCTPK